MTQINSVPKGNSIGGGGSLVQNMTSKLVYALTSLGVADTLIDAGGPDHNRATLFHTPTLALPSGTRYLGLRPDQTSESFGYLGDAQRAERRKAARLSVDLSVNDQHIQGVRGSGLESVFNLFFYSITAGHTLSTIERLDDLARRLPEEIRMGYTVLAHEQTPRDALATNYQLPVQLVERGLLTISIVVDNRSAIVTRYGRAFQDQLAVNALAGLMAAIWHFSNQRGPSDAAQLLSLYEAQATLSFGVRHLVPDPEVSYWKPIRKAFGFGARGSGSLEDTILQTLQVAQDALTEPLWRALDEDIHPQKQAVMVLQVPFRRSDTRWRSIVPAVEHWLEVNHPYVLPLWVSGSGAALPTLAALSPYWVQASVFFPIPPVPRAVQIILKRKPLLRRATPPPSPGNGTSALTPELTTVSPQQPH